MTWPTWWQWVIMGAVLAVPVGIAIGEIQVRRDIARDRRDIIASWTEHHG